MEAFILLPVFVPILAGIALFFKKEPDEGFTKRTPLLLYTGIALAVTGALVLVALLMKEQSITLFHLTETLPIYFKTDALGKFFAAVVTIVWILAGFFSFEYMKHEKHEKRYYAFYLIVFGVLIGLDFSGNVVTFYMFYELMTLLSMPMVLHNLSREAIMAGLKYMFYSFFGAYMALFGLFFLNKYATTLNFTAGGTLNMELVSSNQTLMLIVAFCMIMGFSVKAGMFPLHAWLPTAHPVAPAPASAVLSGIIVKAGVLGIIRVVFYIFGADFIRGTWVQYAWMILALITVFMGSMLAYLEKGMKKRLAYSTVSQLSYILFGLAILNPIGMTGALLHVIFHAFIKTVLFLAAGAIIYKTGKTNVDELRGIGKEMPITIWCFTIVSLGLIGIPPMSGFISKWYLAIGALDSGIRVFAVLGPIVLLVSALLTAGYLLPVTIKGFFPGADYDYSALQKKEPNKWMTVPMLLMIAFTILLGIFPNQLIEYINQIVSLVM